MRGLRNPRGRAEEVPVLSLRTAVFVLTIAFFALLPASAQIHGIPPSVTSIPNHVPPFLPNAPASVTSLGPYGYCCSRPSNIPYRNPAFPNRYNRRGYGYGYGYGAAVPYYYLYPAYDPGYDTGGMSSPYLYSGPPQGQTPPAEQTLHIIVETAPTRTAPSQDDMGPDQAAQGAPAIPSQEPGPGVPTLLVFRDGHHQEVTNYAIMGQTVYVFDKRTQKIALADLDIPATVKANDDEGVEFKVPGQKKSAGKPAAMPRQSAPAASSPNPNNLTSSLVQAPETAP